TALLPWVVPALVLLGWQWASSTGLISTSILPPPSKVLDTARNLWAAGELQTHLLVSVRRIVIGFTIGAGIGLVLGFAVGLSRIAEGLVDRTLQMLRALPHLALVPLLIAAFGIGELPKVLLVTLGVIFPVYLNTVAGIRTVDPKLVQLGRSYGLGRGELIRQVIVPGAMPMILTGIRYALGVAWLTLVIAETIATSEGIGFLAQNGRDLLRNDRIVLAIVLYALAGLLADQLIRLVEARVLRWNPNYRKGTR
ncbi:ABC transporter permease subunit, partial [Rhodococcus sp. O3]|uniref:ABC transporter permease subunit n=1 Tax=Rhodococcus sp. O3 TaxID=3404919 RepID=UPI003B673E8E